MSEFMLVIVGDGGHSKVVCESARAAGVFNLCVIDEHAGDSLEGAAATATHFLVAIGDNEVRARVFARALDAGLTPYSIVDPSAVIASSAVIGRGVFIAPRAVVNPFATIEDDAIINTGAIVEHDCVVSAHGFVAPGAVMCGACRLGEYAFLGANATMIPLVELGRYSIAGAGATLTKSFGDFVLVSGTPAQKMKDLSA